MENAPQIDAYDLIRCLKHFTKSPSTLLCSNHCVKILNGFFMQNLDENDIKHLLQDINKGIKGEKLNSMDEHVLNSSALHILINTQLRNYTLEDIFRDLFNTIQKNGVIHKEDLKAFFQLCNINMPENALVSLCQIHLKMEHTTGTIDYPTFIKLIEMYLKKKK